MSTTLLYASDLKIILLRDNFNNVSTNSKFGQMKMASNCQSPKLNACTFEIYVVFIQTYLDITKIEVVSESKFPGVIFDRKLSFLPHITALKKKYKEAFYILKVVAHSERGADRKVLLLLYRSLIGSKIRLWIYCIRICL